jgi:outer membrane immunogenic protein
VGDLGNPNGAFMKKILLTTIALSALVAVPAMAADVGRPVYRAPPAAPVYPVYGFSWTGCYIGGHIGGLWAHKEWFDHDPGSLTFGQSDGTHDPSGVLGGLQAGCDYQFAGGFVAGIAGDYAWTDADGSNLSLLFPGFTNHSRVKSLSSVTGRVGYAWDRFLGYVKGGGAWERDEYDFTGGVIIGTASETRSGWTVGVGAEYAFTNFLSGFVEYNHYDFGDRDVIFLQNNGFTSNVGIKETKDVVKAGLNLRWGGGQY